MRTMNLKLTIFFIELLGLCVLYKGIIDWKLCSYRLEMNDRRSRFYRLRTLPKKKGLDSMKMMLLTVFTFYFSNDKRGD